MGESSECNATLFFPGEERTILRHQTRSASAVYEKWHCPACPVSALSGIYQPSVWNRLPCFTPTVTNPFRAAGIKFGLTSPSVFQAIGARKEEAW